MAWTYSYTTNKPVGTDSPTDIDTMIKDGVKLALQERLAVDHVFAISSNTVDAANTGMHNQITFAAAQSKPTAAATQAILYIREINSLEELCFVNDSGDEVQITSGALLATPAVDDVTIEYDVTNGLQILVPTKGVGATAAKSPVMLYGEWTGNAGTNRDIDLGVGYKIIWVSVMHISGTGAASCHLTNGTTKMSRGYGADASQISRIIVNSDRYIKLVTGGNESFNYTDAVYHFTALCERA